MLFVICICLQKTLDLDVGLKLNCTAACTLCGIFSGVFPSPIAGEIANCKTTLALSPIQKTCMVHGLHNSTLQVSRLVVIAITNILPVLYNICHHASMGFKLQQHIKLYNNQMLKGHAL